MRATLLLSSLLFTAAHVPPAAAPRAWTVPDAEPSPRPAAPRASADTLRLVARPASVYKIDDPGRRGTESWFVDILVQDDLDRSELRPVAATVEILAGDDVLERRILTEETLDRMRRVSYRVLPTTPPLAGRRVWPSEEVFDLRFETWARPAEWEADLMRVTLQLEVPGAGPTSRSIGIRLQDYQQRTELIFPMRGRGIVTQGQVNNHGHSGPANRFALDVMGLGPEYGPMGGGGQGNGAFAGWGREIIAPAAGTVVYARNDVPDNAPGGGDPADVYGRLPDPILAIAGNCVIIDHGSGEYSALMHMRAGSVAVEVGDTVEQGEKVGEMGASGDAFGVHLHYQLQDGPELLGASSLPVRFGNLEMKLDRGTFFEAR